MEEKIEKLVKRTGGIAITLGILSIVAGVTIGVLTIVNGGKLLKGKSNILY
ncbi:MAG: hypothetical protein GX225_01680 [Clostridiales bacterium]|nr:hypothetical protein [Clostridiales bacterium]